MTVARASQRVAIPPPAAFALWLDTSRWGSFVDGFARVDQLDQSWPAAGSQIVWQSVAGGRGTVTERVLVNEASARFETHVSEERLAGTQTVSFERDGDGSAVTLTLDYTLPGSGPLRWLTDVLFIRRAEADALSRTLARFASEAGAQAER